MEDPENKRIKENPNNNEYKNKVSKLLKEKPELIITSKYYSEDYKAKTLKFKKTVLKRNTVDSEINYIPDELDDVFITEHLKFEDSQKFYKQTVEEIIKAHRINKRTVFNKSLEKFTSEGEICGVCLSSENKSIILKCFGCNINVHSDCYGYYKPDKEFLCDPCKENQKERICIVCEKKGSVFKKTLNNKYIHLVCALWTKGVYFNNISYFEGIEYIPKENPEITENEKKCEICGKNEGNHKKCDYKTCNKYFHIPCAIESQTNMDSKNFILYCQTHKPVFKRLKKNVKIDTNYAILTLIPKFYAHKTIFEKPKFNELLQFYHSETPLNDFILNEIIENTQNENKRKEIEEIYNFFYTKRYNVLHDKIIENFLI